MASQMVLVDAKVVELAIRVCVDAIGTAEESLAKHDSFYGRTTQKNSAIAQSYQDEIAAATKCEDLLRQALDRIEADLKSEYKATNV